MQKFVFFSVLIVLLELSFTAFSDRELDLVIIAFRHGERTPYRFFLGDPYMDAKYWPDGETQLLASGKRRMYRLGKSLRQKYKSFLTSSPREVYARSSTQDRCIESAQLLLHGIYKPENRWIYDNFSDFLPIPIHTIPTKDDNLLTVDCDCPEAKEEKKRLVFSEFSDQVLSNYSDTLQLIYNKTGNDLTDLNLLSDYYVTLLIEKEQGFKLPEWMDSKFFADLKNLSDLSYFVTQSSKRIRQFRMSNLFAEIKEKILEKCHLNDTTGPSVPRLVAYSTHDSVISPLLGALEIFDTEQPPYGSMVLIEVSKDEKGERFVQIAYWKNTEDPEPINKYLPYCNSIECPLNEFFIHLDEYILEDWRSECGLSDCESLWNDPIFIVLIVLLLSLLLALILWCYKSKNYSSSREGYQQITT